MPSGCSKGRSPKGKQESRFPSWHVHNPRNFKESVFPWPTPFLTTSLKEKKNPTNLTNWYSELEIEVIQCFWVFAVSELNCCNLVLKDNCVGKYILWCLSHFWSYSLLVRSLRFVWYSTTKLKTFYSWPFTITHY